MIILIRNLMAR